MLMMFSFAIFVKENTQILVIDFGHLALESMNDIVRNRRVNKIDMCIFLQPIFNCTIQSIHTNAVWKTEGNSLAVYFTSYNCGILF